MLAACGGSSPDERSEAEGTSHAKQATAALAPSVFYERSFVITDRQVLDKIAPDFQLGSLLYAVSRNLNQLALDNPDWGKEQRDPKFFALHPFKGGARDVDAHNALSDTDPNEAKVGTVPVIYNTFRNVILKDGAFDPDLGIEPFRLIAVVNRLDLAGDFDMRGGGILGGAERRWFGEARFVFSVDRTLPDGSPMPMTVSAEYRLPALKRNASGTITLDNSFIFADGPVDEADWRHRRQLWAQVWQELSAHALNSPEYISRLRTILSWTAYGVRFDRDLIKASTNASHNLAFRTGEQVRVGLGNGGDQQGDVTDEFEYREFYLNDNWMLSTRKLRREPFDCAGKSITLADRIAAEWWSSTNSMAWRYTLGERNLEGNELAELQTICGRLPYGQVDDNGDTQLRAKFARFTATSVWRTRKSVSEAQVHSFALGSCSGCHAGETGTQGFHIAPAPAGQPALLSAFLSPQQQPTSSTPRGTPYSSDEPGRRMKLVARFANGDPNMTDEPLLFDIDCKHVDVPCRLQP
jgi:hypothetical protein